MLCCLVTGLLLRGNSQTKASFIDSENKSGWIHDGQQLQCLKDEGILPKHTSLYAALFFRKYMFFSRAFIGTM